MKEYHWMSSIKSYKYADDLNVIAYRNDRNQMSNWIHGLETKMELYEKYYFMSHTIKTKVMKLARQQEQQMSSTNVDGADS